MRYSLILVLGIVLGLFLAEHTTVYRMSCDMTKYSWTWRTQYALSIQSFKCKDSNQIIERETNPYMIIQMIGNNLGIRH